MAVVDSPSFDLEAGRSVGGILNLSTWKGIFRVKRYKIPSNIPPTFYQVTTEVSHIISDEWNSLSPAEKIFWTSLAAGMFQTGNELYARESRSGVYRDRLDEGLLDQMRLV